MRLKYLVLLTVFSMLPISFFGNWNKASNTLSSFFKAMNNLDKNEARKYCAQKMLENFDKKIVPFFKRAANNPIKYKANYYIFKKEKTGQMYVFYVFIFVPYQKAVRYGVFYVERINGTFKITRTYKIKPIRIVSS